MYSAPVDNLGRYNGIRKTFATTFQLVAPPSTNTFAFDVIQTEEQTLNSLVRPFMTIQATAAPRVIRMGTLRINGLSLTAAQVVRIGLVKYTTLPTGGTFTNPVIVQEMTSADVTRAQVNAYTVAPTGGLSMVGGGAVRQYVFSAVATGSDRASTEVYEQFDTNRTEQFCIIAPNECLGLAFMAPTASAVTLSVSLEWTEDNV